MALAQRLNELSIANSNGLLNDDEYRLLRQSVFEECSTNVVIPVEAPVVPIARVHVQVRCASPSSPPPNYRRATTKHIPEARKSSHSPSPVRHKPSVTSGVANLLRRATSRLTLHDTPTTKEPRKSHTSTQPIQDSPKRTPFIPRLLNKKSTTTEFHPLRTENSRPITDALHATSISRGNDDLFSPVRTRSVSKSVKLNLRSNTPSTSSLHRHGHAHPEGSISTILDVFDDESLSSAKDIGDMIAVTEDEGRRLVDAFDNLEMSTVGRLRKQNARRLPMTTPANVDILLEGREWREHRLIPSPSSSSHFDGKYRHISNLSESTGSDGMSVRSKSSYKTGKTSISNSRSMALLPTIPPVSPLSPHFRTSSVNLQRKNSVSSMSSQGAPSFGMLGVSASSSLSMSRSSSNLPLRALKQSSGANLSTDTIGSPAGGSINDELDDDTELADIRKRREELIARYTARLEFLRAKLKGAELHEKLLKK